MDSFIFKFSVLSNLGLEARLVVTNDGPTILGSNTTFRATLSFLGQKDERLPTLHQEKMLYDYSWEQTICGMVQTVHMKQNLTCNYTQVYSCPEDVGRHSLKVTVRIREFFVYRLIAVNTSEFVITGKSFSIALFALGLVWENHGQTN